jgi:branched-chain amino acid transport system permease protein
VAPSSTAAFGARLWRALGPAIVVLVVQLAVFRVDPLTQPGLYLYGAVVGLMGALVAVGMALVYRANHVLNFAQAELGLLPTVVALALVSWSGIPPLVAFGLGLLLSVVLGGVVDLLVVRRFARASRLILTVATIGVAQLLALGALAAPALWGRDPVSLSPVQPFEVSIALEPIVFGANHLVALAVAPLVLVGVIAFLHRTDTGVAIRAAAERRDRAGLLGVPVKRVQTTVWCLAAALSFIGVFLRAGIAGVPVAVEDGFGATSFGALLAALTALSLGRFTQLGTIAASAVAVGVVEQVVVWSNGDDPALVYPVLAVIILASMVLQRPGRSRAETDTSSSWQATDEARPLPPELRDLPQVKLTRWGLASLVAMAAWWLPEWNAMSSGRLVLASAVVVFGVIGISIVLLTGWAGQVSLGQMGFAGTGAAVGAVATGRWGLDLSAALPLAAVAGAAVALVVGLPALRARGLFLAVTTLAFTITASAYLLNPQYFAWIPTGRVQRPPLFGVIDLEPQATMYRLCIVALVAVVAAMTGIRRSRTGRAMLALRENERGAQAFGIDITRTKLTAFALSGALAAGAGCLLVHVTQRFDAADYGALPSVTAFTATVVGGVGLLAGGILGAVFERGGTWFLQGYWRLLPSAVGVLVVLLAFPSGLGGLLLSWRDRWLASLARRRSIEVPSLGVGAPVLELDDVAAHAEAAVSDGQAADAGALVGDGAPGGLADG